MVIILAVCARSILWSCYLLPWPRCPSCSLFDCQSFWVIIIVDWLHMRGLGSDLSSSAWWRLPEHVPFWSMMDVLYGWYGSQHVISLLHMPLGTFSIHFSRWVNRLSSEAVQCICVYYVQICVLCCSRSVSIMTCPTCSFSLPYSVELK